jgi:CDP-paratose 2-epimerase
MDRKVVVTGGAGLVGSETCTAFSDDGWAVESIDNFMRGKIFGGRGSTRPNLGRLQERGILNHEIDFRDDGALDLVADADVVVHTAAQPSHPRSIEIPLEDFRINAVGTFGLLEGLRARNPGVIFIFCSTNKVYGEMPNYYAYEKVGRRFEPVDPAIRDGFDESLRIDQNMHTPFGVSKAAADLYVQEYARLYGMKTGVFRMGCITGGMAKAVEMHNWEPFFVRKALTGEKLTVYGHGGYQVRDVIHAGDLARLFLEFARKPKPGEVYNVGGGRGNSISLLESFDLIEEVTGKAMSYELGPEREADHIWWISNIRKAESHFDWGIRIGLREIFEEIAQAVREQLSTWSRTHASG